jgi:hypothetical protein
MLNADNRAAVLAVTAVAGLDVPTMRGALYLRDEANSGALPTLGHWGP